MLTNYVKIAFRSLLKFKGFTIINLLGLALGLTAGTLIMVYVLDELSFDQFHEKSARLYRVNTLFQSADSGGGGSNETNGWPIGKILEKDFPEVEAVLYTRSASFLTINQNDKRIRQKIHFASPEFFTLFSFPLIKGNAAKALSEPYAVVISQEMEKKYFQGGDALNKTLVMADTLSFMVTGVMADIPSNSHIQADMIISFSTYQALEPSFSFDDGWGNINMRNYLLLKEGTDFTRFAAKAKNIYMERAGEMMKDWGVSAYIGFEPMKQIYLHTQSGNGMGPVGSMDRVLLMAGIALFVIILACINFINLTTARSVYRAREVGLRKVVGANRGGLIRQFLSESFILTLLSFVAALIMIALILPYFNQLLNKNYQVAHLLTRPVMVGMSGLIIAISLLSGYYPAWIMSALRPVEVLKGKLQSNARGVQLRRTLVVFQFVISASLVIGTFVVIDQLSFMQKQELGFAKDEVFIINSARVNSPHPNAFETFKNELKRISLIQDVSYANSVPGVPGWQGQIAYPEGRSKEEAVSVEYIAVDANYIDVMNMKIVAGRNFDEQREADKRDGLIINETAVTTMGWLTPEEAIGKKITSPSGSPAGEVIGVVKDYHQLGLQQKIGPITMDYAPDHSYLYAIKYKASNTQELVTAIHELWTKTFPGYDFNYFFLDQDFQRQYQSEQRLANVFAWFAIITMLIAMIGLLGLVSFMVVARTKEIGVRKILGANVFSIAKLLSKEFLLLVLIANVIAFPITWFFANTWLQSFAFRMKVSPMLFISTLVIAMAITLLVVSIQTVRAALADPVKSLRYE